MDRYSGVGNVTVAAGYKTALALKQPASQITRQRVYDILFSAQGTPADNALVWNVSRLTAAGAGTPGTTPAAALLDMGSPAASGITTINYSAEPTAYDATALIENSLNQRATFRWVAAPGSEFVVPNTTLVGLGARCKSAGYTGIAEVTMLFQE